MPHRPNKTTDEKNGGIPVNKQMTFLSLFTGI